MKALHYKTPYSDNSLNYDETTNQYFLTIAYCKDQFDQTFRSDGILERRIEKNTNKVYDFIFSRVNSNNVQIVSKILSSTEEGRKFILKLLTYQMEADTQSGYNDLGSTPAINVANGQVIPREEILRNQVTVDVEQLLNNSAKYLGVNIWYAAPLPPYLLFHLKA